MLENSLPLEFFSKCEDRAMDRSVGFAVLIGDRLIEANPQLSGHSFPKKAPKLPLSVEETFANG